jgi:hypothetical protein
MKKVGTKAEVWHGVAEHTSGGLTKAHLTLNAKGHVVSLAKHHQGVKNIAHTLGAHARPAAHRAVHRAPRVKKGAAMLGGYLL